MHERERHLSRGLHEQRQVRAGGRGMRCPKRNGARRTQKVSPLWKP